MVGMTGVQRQRLFMAKSKTSKAYRLSHIDASGRSAMVNVGHKPVTQRCAVAEGWVRVSPELAEAISRRKIQKGDLLNVARLAGILAAKRTDELIPLCHSLALDGVEVEIELSGNRLHIQASVSTSARTGVEMEALTAVSVAALTVIDMGKAVDRGMVIEGIRLLSKAGGQRGDWEVTSRKSKKK